jgi:midasin (ATPase involved in ribosome maturation)
VGRLALDAVSVLGEAVGSANVGDLFVASITHGMNLLYSKAVGTEGSLRLKDKFTFRYEDEYSSDLSLPNFIVQSQEFFEQCNDDRRNICIVLSDGRMNKDLVRTPLANAEQKGTLYLYVILDKQKQEDSVVNYTSTQIEKVNGKTVVQVRPYLSDFPFRFYLLVSVSL